MMNEVIELHEDDSSIEDVTIVVDTVQRAPPPAAVASILEQDDDDSDSDSSLLLGGPVFSQTSATATTKLDKSISRSNSLQVSQQKNQSSRLVSKPPANKQQREEQRRMEKERREEQKRIERLAREQDRIQKRSEKEAAKLAEKESKRRRIQQAQQTSGKFAAEEICILVEPALLQRIETVVTGLQETYAVHPHSDNKTDSIRWIRRDYVSGGAQQALQALQTGKISGYQMLDRMVIVMHEPKEFINMLQRNDVDDDYPLLESWLKSLAFKGKLVLVLHQVTDQLHRDWNAHRRTKQNPPPPTDAELNDAIVWLLIQFQVECILCPTEDQILDTLQKMTRALSEEPYQQQVTELECIKKLKGECADNADYLTKAKDCWIRQLQQVPMMGEAKARHLAQYFPTARSLWDAYQDPDRSEGEKRLLIANLLAEGRQHTKLADSVYRLMTSSNPNEFL